MAVLSAGLVLCRHCIVYVCEIHPWSIFMGIFQGIFGAHSHKHSGVWPLVSILEHAPVLSSTFPSTMANLKTA